MATMLQTVHNHAPSEDNPFQIAQQQIKKACSALKLEPAVFEILKEPAQVLSVSIPVKMDDGKVKTFTGFRSQHTNVLGPCKGGIRFHPRVNMEEIKALSMLMTIKCSVLGLPYGGGKGGVICNPKEMSLGELERLCRGYIRAVASFIGPDRDIPAPDVYTNAQMMAWMMDEYSKIQGYNVPAVITGKPIALGGSLGRAEATATGCVHTIVEAAGRLGLDLSAATASIQGWGNAGSNIHYLLSRLGVKVVAVSDSGGAVYNADGIDYNSLYMCKQTTGSVVHFQGGKKIDPEEVLTLPVDILIPAALENVITAANAGQIKARLVAEAANGPTTYEADEILHEKGIVVIPDILANAGGVTVSYFEWVQNMMHYYWPAEEVNQKLQGKMIQAFRETYDMSRKHRVSLRMGAYMVALDRIAAAMRLRGWL